MKTANLSLGIGILEANWCLSTHDEAPLMQYKSSLKLYSIVLMCLCLCEMHVVKAMHGQLKLNRYALSS